MKRIYLLLAWLCCINFFILSQEISLKYGKITIDELKMTTYENDTSAAAVVLYEDGYTSYNYMNNVGFQVILELKRKMKILKQDGTDAADISIPYYYKSSSEKESISGLEAFAYNLENGKIVKTKLDKKYIFDEEINNRYRQLKFSIPNVKAGTVIEYKYRKTSGFTSDIPDWNVQTTIPVLNSYYEVLIPEYYIFNIDTKGYEKINIIDDKQNQTFDLGVYNGQPQSVTSNSRVLKISAKNVPSIKEEPHVWCVNDFVAGVRFEIKGTNFPGDFYKPYASTWEDLENTLRNKTDFGSNLKMSNPYKNEVKEILSQSSGEEETITKIYALVKDKIRWNESYAFWGNNARDAVKNGTGNNSQINIVLLSALKDAKIYAYPILLSRRNYGRLPYTHPSLNTLNTFIVAAETSEGKHFYMDGSAIYGGLNVLPKSLLVDRARIFNEMNGNKWADLTSISKNQHFTVLKATMDAEGIITCEMNNRYINQCAYDFKSDYLHAKDSVEYIDNQETSNKISITDYSIEGLEPMSNIVNEKVIFTKTGDLDADYIYLNPMFFRHIEKNPFTQSERKLPVEFNYPYSFNMTVIFTVPENFIIEDIPSSLNMSLENNAGKCIYHVTKISDNNLQLSYRFELNQIIFSQIDYEMIREFYGQIANKNNEMIVLKKLPLNP